MKGLGLFSELLEDRGVRNNCLQIFERVLVEADRLGEPTGRRHLAQRESFLLITLLKVAGPGGAQGSFKALKYCMLVPDIQEKHVQ